ncbi:MAG TPA: crosslink repair DNA glycosylase YcaQ family protein, partial [Actinomycetota bacterium]|nr:crosslink repair DNA glycosylase YcaQ family protein [Actinomycetota bacterium]
MSQPLRVSADAVRRLAVVKQALVGAPPKAGLPSLRKVARKLSCIQIDPISHVARTENLVMFSRLGPGFRKELLAKATYERKELFHYFAHAASLVLTEDYPIHNFEMRTWPRQKRSDRVERFMKDNAAMRRQILRRLRTEGPLRSRDFEIGTSNPWTSSGWTQGQTVGRMLDVLWIKGIITIVGKQGMDRVWGLADEWFPDWTPREKWP